METEIENITIKLDRKEYRALKLMATRFLDHKHSKFEDIETQEVAEILSKSLLRDEQ